MFKYSIFKYEDMLTSFMNLIVINKIKHSNINLVLRYVNVVLLHKWIFVHSLNIISFFHIIRLFNKYQLRSNQVISQSCSFYSLAHAVFYQMGEFCNIDIKHAKRLSLYHLLNLRIAWLSNNSFGLFCLFPTILLHTVTFLSSTIFFSFLFFSSMSQHV